MAKNSASATPLAVLVLLADAAMHGDELRQKISATLGSLWVFSCGSLYPTLRRLESAGDITMDPSDVDAAAVPLTPHRSRVVYQLTAAGRDRLVELLRDSGPVSSSADSFQVHPAFFDHTSSEARLRILESRRPRLKTWREGLRWALGKAAPPNGRLYRPATTARPGVCRPGRCGGSTS